MKRIAMIAALLGLAVPARADISDTGDLLIGGQGIIQGTMTVAGSSLSVNGVPYEWPSSQGTSGQVLSNDGSGGLSWADAATAVTSTSTEISFTGWTSGTMWECLEDSTVTISGSRFDVSLDGSFNTGTPGNQWARWGFLIDGGFPDGLGNTVGVVEGWINTNYGIDSINMSGSYRGLETTDASHDFCLLLGASVDIDDDPNSRVLFYVESR